MNELALFAGIGGGILGGKLLGWRTVCAVENDPHAQSILLARQNDKHLETFPIWDDVATFDGRPWKGIVNVVSGGFPCQDISIAGKQRGISGSRSGLWAEMARIIGEVSPEYAFIENSPQLAKLGLDRVLYDLAIMGFDAEWGVIGANAVGADHERKRMWILGTNTHKVDALRKNRPCAGGEDQVTPKRETSEVFKEWFGREFELEPIPVVEGKPSYSAALRVLDGIPRRMDRLARLGNAQVPAVAALAWNTLAVV